MLVGAIIVTGDSTGADIHIVTNLGIAQVAQMARLGTFAQACFFHFDEVADMGAHRQLCARTKTGEWPHGAFRCQHRIFQYAIRADLAVVANYAVFQHAAGTDFHAVAQLDRTFNNYVGINRDVATVYKFPTQIKTRRIQQHYAGQQQLFRLFCLINALKSRQLQAVIHAFHFTQARWMDRLNFLAVGMCQRDDIGDIELTLRVVVVQHPQPALQIAPVGHQDAGIDFIDLTLGFAGILVLNNSHHRILLAHDTTVTARISQFYGQQTNTALWLRRQQALQGIDRDQRNVTVQHQHVFIIGKMRCSLLHGVAGPQLLGLQHPVQRTVGQGLFQQLTAVAVDQMDVLRAQFHRGINDVLHHRLTGQWM